MHFQGKVTDERGDLEISVVGEWEMTTRGDITGWSGSLRVTDEGKGLSMKNYILTLDDGQQVVIGIRGLQESSSSFRIYNFRGQGQPPL